LNSGFPAVKVILTSLPEEVSMLLSSFWQAVAVTAVRAANSVILERLFIGLRY